MSLSSKIKPDLKTQLLIGFFDPEIKAKDSKGRTLDDILSWDDSKLESCHDYIQMIFPLPEGSAHNWNAPIITWHSLNAFRERSELRGRLRESFLRILQFYGFQLEEEAQESSSEEENGLGQGESSNQDTLDHDESPPGKEHVTNEVNQAEDSSSEEQNASTPTHEQDKQAFNGSTSTEQLLSQTENTPAPTSSSTASATAAKPKILRVVRAPGWESAFDNWAVRFNHNHLRMTRIIRSLRVLGLQEECEAFYRALEDAFNDPESSINERSMGYWTKALNNPLHIAPDGEKVAWLKHWAKEAAKKEGKNVGTSGQEQSTVQDAREEGKEEGGGKRMKMDKDSL